MQLLTILFAGGLCALGAYGLAGPRGLQAAGLGLLMGLLLCALSHGLLVWASRSKGLRIVAAMLGGALATLVLLGAFMVAVATLWNEGLAAASLTSVVTYLAYKFSVALPTVLRSDPKRC